MQRLKGIGVSPGVVAGRAVVLIQRAHALRYQIPKHKVEHELARLEESRTLSRAQLLEIQERLSRRRPELSSLFDAQLLMLDDPVLVGRNIVDPEQLAAFGPVLYFLDLIVVGIARDRRVDKIRQRENLQQRQTVGVQTHDFSAIRDHVDSVALNCRRRADSEILPVADLPGAELRRVELPEQLARLLVQAHQYAAVALVLGVARRFIEICEESTADAIVSPSGSCTAMVRHYIQLFQDDEQWQRRASALVARTFELSSFLVRVLKLQDVGARFAGRVTWHDACHGLRDLGIHSEPRRLITHVREAEFVELASADACCGFGGTFSIKYPEISAAIVDQKIETIERAGVDAVISGDASCLMQIGGRLSRLGSKVRAMHLAELLAAT